MDIIQAIILGLVQGATEFVPVSSTGHLVLVPWLLGWQPPSLVFDTMVHWGTLLAVLTYFARDWWRLIAAWVHGLAHRDWGDPDARLMWLIILGTVPAALLGLLLESFFESLFSKPVWTSFFLLLTAALLALGEWLGKRTRTTGDLRWRDALIVGLAQAAAIAPGLSRSGATMSVALLRGLKRTDAARFSFLLSAPIILGAGLVPLLKLLSGEEPLVQVPSLLVGFLVAAMSGYVAIWGMLRYLQRGKLYVFSLYCTWVGVSCLIVGWLR